MSVWSGWLGSAKAAGSLAHVATVVASGAFSVTTGVLAASMITYSGYVLYDTAYVEHQAYASSMDLMEYRPVVIEDEAVPLTSASLSTINEDYRAWLVMDDTKIDYPVMQGPNDLYYVSHDVYKNSSLSGAIYFAAANSPDLSDSYNLVYGHHMDNGAMFGGLDAYCDANYLNAHRTGTLAFSKGVYDLRVFAVAKTDAYEWALYDAGDRMDEVLSHLKNPTEKTETLFYDESLLGDARQIIALSTCASADTNGRLVVFAAMTLRESPQMYFYNVPDRQGSSGGGGPGVTPRNTLRTYPGGTPVDEPGTPPDGTPVDEPGTSPDGTPVDEPGTPPDGTPVDEPGTPPDGTPVDEPGTPPDGTPVDEPGTPPDGTPVDEPGTPPDGTPVDEPGTPPDGTPINLTWTLPDGTPIDVTGTLPDGTPVGITGTLPDGTPITMTWTLPDGTPVDEPGTLPDGTPVGVTWTLPDGTPISVTWTLPDGTPVDGSGTLPDGTPVGVTWTLPDGTPISVTWTLPDGTPISVTGTLPDGTPVGVTEPAPERISTDGAETDGTPIDDTEPFPGGTPEDTMPDEPLIDIQDMLTPLSEWVERFQPRGSYSGKAWALINLAALLCTLYLLFPLTYSKAKFFRAGTMKKINRAKEGLFSAENLNERELLEKTMIEREAVEDKARADGEDVETALREAEAVSFVEVTEEEFADAADKLYYQVKQFLRRFRVGLCIELLVAAVAVAAFLLTENMRLPMVLIDKWTPLMLIFLAVCWITDVRLARYRGDRLWEDQMRRDEAEKILAQ